MKYLMTKKVYKPKYFSFISKNSDWQILTKNLVLKDKMGLRMKNFDILGIY